MKYASDVELTETTKYLSRLIDEKFIESLKEYYRDQEFFGGAFISSTMFDRIILPDEKAEGESHAYTEEGSEVVLWSKDTEHPEISIETIKLDSKIRPYVPPQSTP